MSRKNTCVVCGNSKGKRMCLINHDSFICPVCCTKIRNSDCEECHYYSKAQEYQASKKASSNKGSLKKDFFIAEFNEEVEQSIDKSLQLVEQGFIREAEEQLKKLLHEHPLNHMVLYGIGVCNVMQDRLDEGIEYFDKALAIFPYLVEAQFNKAEAYRAKKNISQAIEEYQRVVEIGDRDDPCVIQANDYLADFRSIVRQNYNISIDEYFQAWDLFDEGIIAMEQHEWGRALDCFDASSNINPNIPQLYGNSALCYAVLGKKDTAIAAFEKAIEVNPEYDLARINRAAFENLPPGEKMSPERIQFTDYYGESG